MRLHRKKDRILYQYGVNTVEVPRSHVIIELTWLDQVVKLTVGDWLDHFDTPEAGAHESLKPFTLIPHYGMFTEGTP